MSDYFPSPVCQEFLMHRVIIKKRAGSDSLMEGVIRKFSPNQTAFYFNNNWLLCADYQIVDSFGSDIDNVIKELSKI